MAPTDTPAPTYNIAVAGVDSDGYIFDPDYYWDVDAADVVDTMRSLLVNTHTPWQRVVHSLNFVKLTKGTPGNPQVAYAKEWRITRWDDDGMRYPLSLLVTRRDA